MDELTEDEEAIYSSINEFYWAVKKTWSRKDKEAGITYPAPEKITDAHLDELMDYVLKLYPEDPENVALREMVEKCKLDKAFCRTVYGKIRKYRRAIEARDEEYKRKVEMRYRNLPP
jgi:hypothetical protein